MRRLIHIAGVTVAEFPGNSGPPDREGALRAGSPELAEAFLVDMIARSGVAAHSLHADRSGSVTSKPVAQGPVTTSASPAPQPPALSNGNPYSRPAAWCGLDDAIHIDGPALRQRHSVGDLASGVTIADAYGDLAQLRAGQPTDAQLTYCLTGVWLGSRFPNAGRPSHRLVLSPGDLDEAALTLLLDPVDGVAALRSALRGFDLGLSACPPRKP